MSETTETAATAATAATDDEGRIKAARRRQAALLVVWGVIGGVAVLPYALALQAERLREVVGKTGKGLLTLAAIGALQTSVIVVIAVLLGLGAARRTGLGAPVSWVISCGGAAGPIVRRFFARAAAVGLGSGVLVAGLDGVVFMPRLPELRAVGERSLREVALWKGALASLYGGVTEEILLRLFVMSVMALVLKWFFRREDGAQKTLPAWLLWTANGLAAGLFAVAHLPATQMVVPLTGLVVVRAVVINGGLGLGLGWLYMRRGLEAAMLGHFLADLVLHVGAPAVLIWLGRGS